MSKEKENKSVLYPKEYYTEGIVINGEKVIPILEAAKEKYKNDNVILEYVPGKFVNVISTDDYGVIRFGPESISTTFGKNVCIKYNINYSN